MKDIFDIGDVARATGLTQRALRFYEAHGLVAPLRTAGGRRVYGRGELERLNAAVALKRAGFSLQRIGELLAGREVDLARLVAAQLARIDAQAAALADARTLLLSVQSRIDQGEPTDVATICSLIRTGETIMNATEWKPVIEDYFTPDARERLRATMPSEFDQEAYNLRWRDLGGRIEAAMPLDPASVEAQIFVDEWFALLKPFSDVATPELWNGVTRMYDDRPNWKADPEMGFSNEVWTFVRAATQARLDAGGAVDGPAWSAGER
jgi:MerR family transcriptional regulator, thiopeptide resistance regulator